MEAAAIGCSTNSTKRRSIGWPSSSLHDLLDLGERERADVVLELSQLDDDVRRNDVGPAWRAAGRTSRTSGRARRASRAGAGLARTPPLRPARPFVTGKEVGQLVAREEVAEAVLDRDLRDLGHPAEVARLRARSHAVSLARQASPAPPRLSTRRSRCSTCASRSSSSSSSSRVDEPQLDEDALEALARARREPRGVAAPASDRFLEQLTSLVPLHAAALRELAGQLVDALGRQRHGADSDEAEPLGELSATYRARPCGRDRRRCLRCSRFDCARRGTVTRSGASPGRRHAREPVRARSRPPPVPRRPRRRRRPSPPRRRRSARGTPGCAP